MTELSRFWNGTAIGDAAVEAPYDAPTEFAVVMMAVTGAAALIDKGGIWLDDLNDFSISSSGANNQTVASGRGQAYGTWYSNDSPISFTIPTPAASTRVDRLVLRKDWAAQTVRMVKIAGVEGAGAPALVQNAGTTWDVPLYQISITTGGVMTVTDQRVVLNGLAGAGVIVSPTGGVIVFPMGATFAGSIEATGTATLGNDQALRWKDSGGTARRIGLLTSGGDLYFGSIDGAWTAAVLRLIGGTTVDIRTNSNVSSVLAARFYESGGVYVGTSPADPGANNLQVQGLVGVGITPSAWAATDRAITVRSQSYLATSLFDSGVGGGVVQNSYWDGTNWKAVFAAVGAKLALRTEFWELGMAPSVAAGATHSYVPHLRGYLSGGVYVGATPADPGAGKLRIESGGNVPRFQNSGDYDKQLQQGTGATPAGETTPYTTAYGTGVSMSFPATFGGTPIVLPTLTDPAAVAATYLTAAITTTGFSAGKFGQSSQVGSRAIGYLALG